jgi:pimeloyl-ACP methyl ester carboxylesterase/DNA-binding CsgD family transcriptional regulator
MDAPPVQYVRTSDGFDIAHTLCGQGEPLVSMPWSFNHLDAFWNADYVRALAANYRLIQYDSRGQGLSSRDLPSSLQLEDYERDLEAVADRLHVQRFVLLAHAQFGHVAARYAARRPERVKALILSTCRIDRRVPHGGVTTAVDMAATNWGLFVTTFRAQFLTFIPEMADALLGMPDMTTQADWLRAIGVFNSSNIEATCRKLNVPTLVTSMDIAGSPMNQVEDAKAMAALIPNASLVLLRGTYAPSLISAIGDFLGRLPSDEEQRPIQGLPPNGLSAREVDVLRLIAAGKSNRQIADALVISLNTVQNHVSSILSKTGLTNRTEAASYARDQGLLLPVPPA